MLHLSMAVCGSWWMPQPSLCLLSVDVETPREHARACGRFDGAAPKRHGSTRERAGGSTGLVSYCNASLVQTYRVSRMPFAQGKRAIRRGAHNAPTGVQRRAQETAR